ncbi:flavin reductase family protein [Flavobacteriaceae bacterium 14752]|uniref:flavin reductase family protein n=1 Tax=Mesohalobacter salilacus TaxID=2491711 RepID=UPI000F644EE5|nr:flavin reductase family protein [Flavobacteriaceae bacterium 14752]
MKSFKPSELETPKLHSYLLGAVGPRPIAFASTLSKNGTPNLSPYSFFNVFSANPPIMIFSPARRVRNNTTKHTLENCKETKEVVINIVNYDIVQQMSLSSTEYAEDVNEFEKSGLTMLKSDVVKPYRVKESPVQFECKVNEIIELGQEGGAGNLIISEVVKLHIAESVLDDNGKIDQYEIDQVARMGGNWYSRANRGMFEVPKPLSKLGIGVDQIPQQILNSEILTGNDLGKLGNVEAFPEQYQIDEFLKSEHLHEFVLNSNEKGLHQKAHEYLKGDDTFAAWCILLSKNL